MNKKRFSRLMASVEEMDEIVRGEREPSREFHVDAEQVRVVRQKTGLSQAKFARVLQIDVGTLRNWEQGRRSPTGPARALIHAINKDPESVLRALMAA